MYRPQIPSPAPRDWLRARPARRMCRVSVPRWALLVMVTLAISGVALGVSAAPASACFAISSSQASNSRGSGDNGTRAYISGSSTLSSCGAAGAFVSIEGNASTGLPMIQTGYIKETSTNVTDCGTGTISVVTEYIDANGNSTCDVTEFNIPFGEGDSFTVEHSSNGWWTYLNGFKQLANPITSLNFCCGYSLTRGETHWTGSLPTFLVWWGPSGSLFWQYRTPTAGYSNVTSSNFNQQGGNHWARSDQKSPFYIQWIG